MNREQATQDLIDEIMDGFDVKKCVTVMKQLNWKWNTEVPDEYAFRKNLRVALQEAVKNGGYASGGFMFTFHDSIDEITGEPFVMFSGGFYLESILTLDGISYSK